MNSVVNLVKNLLFGNRQNTIFTSPEAQYITTSVYIIIITLIIGYTVVTGYAINYAYTENDPQKLQKFEQMYNKLFGGNYILTIGILIVCIFLLPTLLIIVYYAPSMAEEVTNIFVTLGIKNSADIANMFVKIFK